MTGDDSAGVAVKAVLCAVIADLTNGLASDRAVMSTYGIGGNLAHDVR